MLFLLGLAILIVGYCTYGKFIETILEPDNRPTPAKTRADGVDYVELPHWKNMLIQLLNIAGVGPVIGVILGIKFGVIAFVIIPIGNIIGGAVHDFTSGMMSLRHDGANLPALIRMTTGKTFYFIFSLFMIFLLLLVVAVFDFGNYTNTDRMFYALVGLAVGWFAGQMLLSRSTRVFAPRKWLGLVVLTAVVAAAMGLTRLDPLGIVDWIPQAGDLKRASISVDYSYNCPLEDPEEVETVLQLHELAIKEHWTREALRDRAAQLEEENPDAETRWLEFTLVYEDNNGWTSTRTYYMPAEGEGADMIRELTSTLTAVFSRYGNRDLQIRTEEDLMAQVQKPQSIYVEDIALPPELLTEETLRSLFQAIIADCQAGHLSQEYLLHPVDYYDNQYGGTAAKASYYIQVSLNRDFFFSLDFFVDSENILAWAESMGITLDMIRGIA